MNGFFKNVLDRMSKIAKTVKNILKTIKKESEENILL